MAAAAMEEVAKAAAAMEGVAKEATAAMQGVAKVMTAKAVAAMTTCQPPSPRAVTVTGLRHLPLSLKGQ
eukprot:scaffold24795_cov73-Isochrysis_galbana.AAC.1